MYHQSGKNVLCQLYSQFKDIKSAQNIKISKMNLRVSILDLRKRHRMKCVNTLHPMGYRRPLLQHFLKYFRPRPSPPRWRQELTIGICIE